MKCVEIFQSRKTLTFKMKMYEARNILKRSLLKCLIMRFHRWKRWCCRLISLGASSTWLRTQLSRGLEATFNGETKSATYTLCDVHMTDFTLIMAPHPKGDSMCNLASCSKHSISSSKCEIIASVFMFIANRREDRHTYLPCLRGKPCQF